MHGLAVPRGIDLSSASAAVLRAIALGLPDFETGTSNACLVQSTCSHLASVISLRRAPVNRRRPVGSPIADCGGA